MSKFDVKDFKLSVQTVEEYEALLEAYKKSNPEKYAAKLASGEFDKFKATLPGKLTPEVKEVKEVKKAKKEVGE